MFLERVNPAFLRGEKMVRMIRSYFMFYAVGACLTFVCTSDNLKSDDCSKVETMSEVLSIANWYVVLSGCG